jgi:UDP-N-acetylglucosamine 2-epimerase (non-hydrolysing)
MRDNTERPEGIDASTARLVGTNTREIKSSVELLLNNQSEYDKMAKAVNPYGDGKASEKIYDFVLHQL